MNFLKKIFKQKPISFYKSLGEETGVYELVKNFYDVMESDPYAHDCLIVHKRDESGAVSDIAKKKALHVLIRLVWRAKSFYGYIWASKNES